MDKSLRELEWHDHASQRRHALDDLLYDPPAFDSIVKAGFTFLRLGINDRVLDMGCGEGKETAELAANGAMVISTDISTVQLARARALVKKRAPNACVLFVQTNAEFLPFAAGTFKNIYGKAILHHLDLARSAQEIDRLLMDGGRATFAEPMANHPIFWLARRLTPKFRTVDEQPLNLPQLLFFSKPFKRSTIQTFFLITPFSYAIRVLPHGESMFRKFHAILTRIDHRLFGIFPWLRQWSWYALVNLEK